jgi:hypothetical protein
MTVYCDTEFLASGFSSLLLHSYFIIFSTRKQKEILLGPITVEGIRGNGFLHWCVQVLHCPHARKGTFHSHSIALPPQIVQGALQTGQIPNGGLWQVFCLHLEKQSAAFRSGPVISLLLPALAGISDGKKAPSLSPYHCSSGLQLTLLISYPYSQSNQNLKDGKQLLLVE